MIVDGICKVYAKGRTKVVVVSTKKVLDCTLYTYVYLDDIVDIEVLDFDIDRITHGESVNDYQKNPFMLLEDEAPFKIETKITHKITRAETMEVSKKSFVFK